MSAEECGRDLRFGNVSMTQNKYRNSVHGHGRAAHRTMNQNQPKWYLSQRIIVNRHGVHTAVDGTVTYLAASPIRSHSPMTYTFLVLNLIFFFILCLLLLLLFLLFMLLLLLLWRGRAQFHSPFFVIDSRRPSLIHVAYNLLITTVYSVYLCNQFIFSR